MYILDIFYNKIIKEASMGTISSFFTYNIAFATKILEDEIEYPCHNAVEGVMLPTLLIKDKSKVNELLIEYVEEAKKFYDDSNFAEEVINASVDDKDKISKEKTIMALLFSNASLEDFNNFELYLQKRINFLKNSQEMLIDLGYSNFLKSDLKFEIAKNSIYNETPYQFVLTSTNEDGETFTFPKISFGISDGKVYVYAIQNSLKQNTPYAKKINRILYKVGEGFDSSIDNAQIYEEGNLKDITPSFLYVANAFVSVYRNFGYQDFDIVSYLVERWNAKRIAIQNRINIGKIDDEKVLLDEQQMIQENLTEKFLRTFLRLAHHDTDIHIKTYPGEASFDLNLHVDSTFDQSKKNVNNSLLSESDTLISNSASKRKI